MDETIEFEVVTRMKCLELDSRDVILEPKRSTSLLDQERFLVLALDDDFLEEGYFVATIALIAHKCNCLRRLKGAAHR